MRPLRWMVLAALVGASPLAGAQTLEDARRSIDRKEHEKARDILEKLSAQGITEAEAALAEMYIRPIGIPRNTQRGIALYESAARKNHTESMFFLANELAKGGLVAQDRKRSMGLMRTAAKLKHAGAQFSMCVELGTEGGGFYDAVEAYAWCETCSKKKHKQADDAARRGKDTLAKIQAKQGPERRAGREDPRRQLPENVLRTGFRRLAGRDSHVGLGGRHGVDGIRVFGQRVVPGLKLGA